MNMDGFLLLDAKERFAVHQKALIEDLNALWSNVGKASGGYDQQILCLLGRSYFLLWRSVGVRRGPIPDPLGASEVSFAGGA